MTSLLASLVRDRSGSAAAEMVLVTPLLMTILFGAFEAGNYFWNEHIVIKGVRDAARFAGRQSFSDFDCGTGTVSGSVASEIKNVARTGQIIGGTARLSGWVDNDVTVGVSCSGTYDKGIYDGHAGGAPIVTVTATVAYTSLFGLLGFDTSGSHVTASSQAAVMGI